MNSLLDRARGCLLGQLAGDALGSLVEFEPPGLIRSRYPEGVRELVDGGTWTTIAGQPTDDSEMALVLARMLVERGTYSRHAAHEAYLFWLGSGPFDRGTTISAGLSGRPNHRSQANGAMMRISPLAIFGANHELEAVAEWARQDAELTHPNPTCMHANSLYAMAISYALKTSAGAGEVYQAIMTWAAEMNVTADLMGAIEHAADAPPADYLTHQGWVLIALQNALWQLLHATDFEEGVVGTVMCGGDTDTNAAICGALLGAVHGRQAVPDRWVDRLLDCRPEAGRPGVRRPRPRCFWPVDVLELAEQLVATNKARTAVP